METTDQKSTGSSCIDEDLWPEIFKRLPTKSLGRFRCVSKSWKSVISSPLMINLHRSFNHSATPANLKPYLFLLSEGLNSYSLCGPPNTNFTTENVNHDVLHFPFRYVDCGSDDKSLNLVDVIEGVICISYCLDSAFDSTILWNPSIHKYVALPRLPYSLDPCYARSLDGYDYAYGAIGFGRNNSNNDFKVVRIWIRMYFRLQSSPLSSMYEVYSARQGTWRTAMSDINFMTSNPADWNCMDIKTGCFANGNIYWLLDDENVLGFDCESEEFTMTELPDKLAGTLRLSECAGMLSAAVYTWESFTTDVRVLELWVMEEDHDWKKLYRIPESSYVLYSTENFLSLEKLFPYGPHEWLKLLSLDDTFSRKVSGGHVYEESLILMDDPEAQSYSKNDIVSVYSKDKWKPNRPLLLPHLLPSFALYL